MTATVNRECSNEKRRVKQEKANFIWNEIKIIAFSALITVKSAMQALNG